MATNKYIKNLHREAASSTHANARILRQVETEPEKKLWTFLRDRRLGGKKFRRQHALGGYVLDFYCHECKLAVELDGHAHKLSHVRDYDRMRTCFLNENGITVIRFWNNDVMNNPVMVLQKISIYLEALSKANGIKNIPGDLKN